MKFSPQRRKPPIAMDRSLRSVDADGHMRVEESRISKGNICPYYGREIPDWERLGLDPDRKYRLFRHPDEVAKAASTFNGKPLLIKHVPVSAEDPHQSLTVGCVGVCTFEPPYLISRPLSVWTQEAIDLIESEERRELSAAYRYDADMTPGVYAGESYDGVMRNLEGNHVAIVKEGRAGHDVHVADSLPPEFSMSTAAAAMIAILPHLKDVPESTRKRIAMALDEELGKVAGESDISLDESEKSAAEDAAMEEKRAEHGEDAEPLTQEEKEAAWAKAKDKKAKDSAEEGAEDEDKEEGEDADPDAKGSPEEGAEDEDDDKKAEDEDEPEGKDEEPAAFLEMKGKKAKDKKARDAKRAKDDNVDHRDDFASIKSGKAPKGDKRAKDSKRAHDSVTMDELTRAVARAKREARAEAEEANRIAMDAAIKEERERERALAQAREAVKPITGPIAMDAYDTAEQIYRYALTVAGRKNAKKVHASALPELVDTLVEMKRRAPAAKSIAMDAAKSAKVDILKTFGVPRAARATH